MIVYHGGTDVIEKPNVGIGRAHLDFDKGFYVTDIRSQAKSWAKRVADRRLLPPILNVYDLDIDAIKENYNCKIFKEYDKEWLDFIVGNRKGLNLWKGYDMIVGGVADDRVIDTVEAYIAELMSEEMALKRLAIHQPNNQLCLLSQLLVDTCLKYVESIKLQDNA